MSPQLGISCFAVTPLLFFPPFPHVTFFLFPDSTRRQKKTALFISLPRREKPLTDSVLHPASSPGLLQAIKTKQVCLRQRVQGEAADSPEDGRTLCCPPRCWRAQGLLSPASHVPAGLPTPRREAHVRLGLLEAQSGYQQPRARVALGEFEEKNLSISVA